MSVRLESWYVPGERGAGSMRLRLVNAGPSAVAGFELVLTTVVQLTPAPPARLVSRTSGHHVIAPPVGLRLEPGAVWELDAACGHRPGHGNDGPASAFLVLADGTTTPVPTGPTVRIVRSATERLHVTSSSSHVVAAAWAAASQREQRLYPHDAPVLSVDDGTAVAARIDTSLATDEFVIDGDRTVAAGSPTGLQQAFTTLARDQRAGVAASGRHRPAHGWRGLHVDLARQFFPAADVEWLIDIVAWHGFNRLHLHLTDDEAWRVPIAAYPALTEVGAWRGDALGIPPLLGSGAPAYGGFYSREEVAGWVGKAAAAGIGIVPEVDLPGHCFAALAAMPRLRDPADRSGAVSVQHFVDNVLNPGVATTWPFLEAVFGELADLFPSPWLHIGGDEVPDGAWSASPAAQAYAVARSVKGSHAIGAAFMGDIIELAVTTTGRRIGVWQEAAESGALRPGKGYVVGWKSVAECQRLAAAGYDLVASPAEVYYLDMASDTAWDTPGTSWAGHSSAADIEAFDVTAGWSDAERANLMGIQACIWTEHARDRPSLERLLFPRLDAIATAAWTRQ